MTVQCTRALPFCRNAGTRDSCPLLVRSAQSSSASGSQVLGRTRFPSSRAMKISSASTSPPELWCEGVVVVWRMIPASCNVHTHWPGTRVRVVCTWTCVCMSALGPHRSLVQRLSVPHVHVAVAIVLFIQNISRAVDFGHLLHHVDDDLRVRVYDDYPHGEHHHQGLDKSFVHLRGNESCGKPSAHRTTPSLARSHPPHPTPSRISLTSHHDLSHGKPSRPTPPNATFAIASAIASDLPSYLR